MTALSIVLDIVLILISLVLIAAVLMQQGQRQGHGFFEQVHVRLPLFSKLQVFRRVDRLGGDAGQPAQLSRQGGNDILGGVQRHADDVDAPLPVGYPHPADDIGAVLVQQVVQGRHGSALPDDDGQHSHAGLHGSLSLL